MIKALTAQGKANIQQAILDRWNPHRLTWKIANHFDLSENQVRHIKGKATFKAEYSRQLAIYQGSFDDIRLADGYIESFNGKLRDELLNGEVFSSVPEAKVLTDAWRQHYNHHRPHSALGYRPPAPVVIKPKFAATS